MFVFHIDLVIPLALAKSIGTLELTFVHLSVSHKNFKPGSYLLTYIKDKTIVFCMHSPCDKPFQMISCCDLDL